jgi:hypothetical protein
MVAPAGQFFIAEADSSVQQFTLTRTCMSHPILYGGQVYPSTEHLYEALKVCIPPPSVVIMF